MSIYAIGDVQGCYAALVRLIEKIHFRPDEDTLWFVGDLVNRGKDSVSVLRFVKDLGPGAVTVLGNHDIHLLGRAEDLVGAKKRDTLDEVLTAPDRDELVAWLRARPLIHRENGFVMVHAGLLPGWTAEKAMGVAREVERELRTGDYRAFLRYHSSHDLTFWSDDLTGFARLSVITNVLTRLRVCKENGEMEFSFSGSPAAAPGGFRAWFSQRGESGEETVLYGHWSALGWHIEHDAICLDSGCVWGGQLTALRLEDRQVFQVRCR